MQRYKLLFLGHRLLLNRLLIKNTCVPLYVEHHEFHRPVSSGVPRSLLQPTVEVCRWRPLCSSAQGVDPEKGDQELSLFQRYKKMLKEYWYVLVPVHMATSAVWFGGFYYAATQGLDIVPFLEWVNLPEFLITPLRNSSLGHLAVASALYKLATPARYMVTLYASTTAVRQLTRRGLIRPAPTKQQIKTILQNKMKKDKDSS